MVIYIQCIFLCLFAFHTSSLVKRLFISFDFFFPIELFFFPFLDTWYEYLYLFSLIIFRLSVFHEVAFILLLSLIFALSFFFYSLYVFGHV